MKGRYNTYGYYAQRIGGAPVQKGTAYKGWDKGNNNFAEHNEIKPNEYYEGVNVQLVGKGSVQMPRFGSTLITTKAGVSKCNGGGIFKSNSSNEETPLIMFDGRLYKLSSGNLVEIDSSKTWDTNARISGVMYRGYFYFGNGIDPLSKANLTSVVRFTEVPDPTSITVTYTGGGTNKDIYTYGVTIVTEHGETAFYESGQYWADTLDTSHYFTITTPRNSSPEVIGYNFYRSKNGSRLTFIKYVPQPVSGDPQYIDNGVDEQSLLMEAPAYNTTGGVKGKYCGTYKDTLFVAGVNEYPDYLFYTGTGEYYDSFSLEHNGGFIRIGNGDGYRITGIHDFDTFLLVIREQSVYKFEFTNSGAPGFYMAEPLYGSSYPFSIVKFEKDLIMLANDKTIRTLGYQPTLINVIRTNDLSNRIQPILDDDFDFSNPDGITGIYYDKNYILCDGNIAVVYGNEYSGFHGKWTNYNYALLLKYKDSSENNYLVGVKNNGEVLKLLVNGVYDDNGQTIVSSFRPKTVDGGEDTLVKFFKFYKIKFKSAKGSFFLGTYLDGITTEDERTLTTEGGTGISYFMWGQPSFGETSTEEDYSNYEIIGATSLYTKEIYQEGYYLHPRIVVEGNEDNHLIIQTMTFVYDFEDIDYFKNENVIEIDG